MVKELLTLANLFVSKVAELEKTAAKTKMSRKQMAKNLEKAKGKYKKLKDSLEVFEADDAKMKSSLDETRKSLNAERKAILKMHEALEKMDLSDSNDAVFYDDDIGYVVDGKEYHLEIDDDGNLQLTPMAKHRKAKKQNAEAETPDKSEEADQSDVADVSNADDEDLAMADDQDLLDLLNSTTVQ